MAHIPPSEDVARTTATDLPLESNGHQPYGTVPRHRPEYTNDTTPGYSTIFTAFFGGQTGSDASCFHH